MTEGKHLWQSLEVQHAMPRHKDLPYLSGLLDEAFDRFVRAWEGLPATIQRQLVRALVEMAEADFEMDFSAIFRYLLDHPDDEICALAIEGLFEVEDIRLVPIFVRLLQPSAKIRTRVAAAQALSNFVLLGELQKIRPKPFAQARQALLDTYYDFDNPLEVRRRVVEALAYTELDGVPEIIAEAYEHAEEKMRISAVFAMGRNSAPRWEEIIQQELHNPNPEMRYEAAHACGAMQLQQATRDLVALTEDVDAEVQLAALWALGQIGGDLARRTLERYLESDNEALQDAAHDAIHELEFLYGDLDTFFGPPNSYPFGEDLTWDEEDELLWDEEDEDFKTWEL